MIIRMFLLLVTLLPLLRALPTMVRLGYPNCASCHISPQGAGLLNSYGRAIDLAQSLKGGEPTSKTNSILKILAFGGRLTQDVRYAGQEQATDSGGHVLGVLRDRFMYRGNLDLGRGFRVYTQIVAEDNAAPRPSLKYDRDVPGRDAYVSSALLSWRPREWAEFAVGRDALPTGLNLSDLSIFIKSRERAGYYDFPTQVKAFFWTKRFGVTGYAFAPSGIERSGEHESGEGILTEVDVLGKKKDVVGINLLRGSSALVDRTLVGPYVRLGFGRWGLFGEWDVTERTINITRSRFRQQAAYGQVFWAYREWLVPSLIAQRLTVQAPFHENLLAGAIEVAARLNSSFTVAVNTQLQRNEITGAYSRSATLRLTVKSVN